MKKSFKSPILWILSAVLAAHGLLLISDYTYWDGWWLTWFLKNGKLAPLQAVFSQVGIPLVGYYESLYSVFSHPNYAAKIVSFLFFLVVASCSYKIIKASRFFSGSESLIITVLFITYPGFQAIGDLTVIHYITGHMLFWVAAYLAIQSRSTGKWYFRCLSLSLFFLSFNNNALLPYYGAFFFFFAILLGNQEKFSFSLKHHFARVASCTDFLLLPLAYWTARHFLTPTHGTYEGYNQLDWKNLLLIPKYKNLFTGSVFPYFTETFESFLTLPILPIFLSVLIIRLLYIRLWNNPEAMDPFWPAAKRNVAIISWGFFMLFLATIAHMLVRGVGLYVPHTEDSRANILIGLPLAFLLLGSAKLVLTNVLQFSQKFSTFVLLVVVLIFIFANNRSYIEWQASAVKHMSIFQKLKADKKFQDASVIIVNDQFKMIHLGTYMDPSIRIYYVGSVFNDLKRFGVDIDQKPVYANRGIKIPQKEIQDMIDLTGRGNAYRINSIDIAGRQIDVKISSTWEKSIYWLPITYWRNYYFSPANLNTFLESVSKVEISER